MMIVLETVTWAFWASCLSLSVSDLHSIELHFFIGIVTKKGIKRGAELGYLTS